MTVHALDRSRALSPPAESSVAVARDDIVDAVMDFTADSREAALVVEDLMATGRIRFEFLKETSPGGGLGVARCSGKPALRARRLT